MMRKMIPNGITPLKRKTGALARFLLVCLLLRRGLQKRVGRNLNTLGIGSARSLYIRFLQAALSARSDDVARQRAGLSL
jgi:hypothetical protein